MEKRVWSVGASFWHFLTNLAHFFFNFIFFSIFLIFLKIFEFSNFFEISNAEIRIHVTSPMSCYTFLESSCEGHSENRYIAYDQMYPVERRVILMLKNALFENFRTFERHSSNWRDVTYVMLYIFRKPSSRAY